MRPCRRDDRRRRYGSPHRTYRAGQRRSGRRGDRVGRCLRLHGHLSGGPRPTPGLFFDIRGVLGALGIATGATHGLLQETTREVRWVRSTQIVAGHRTHPLRVAGMIGTVAAVVIAGSSPLWSRQLFVEGRWLSVGLLSVGVAGFCAQATLLGALAGVDRWTQYGSLMVTDAVIRLAVAAAAVVIGWGLAGYLWAATAGAVAWLLMLMASPTARSAASSLTPGESPRSCAVPLIR